MKGETMNENNLTPFTTENAKENGSKGGTRAGETKRERKRIREIAEMLLNSEAKSETAKGLLQEFEMPNGTNVEALAIRLVKSALRGDVRSARLLYELLGELDKGTDIKIEITQQEREQIQEQTAQETMDYIYSFLTDEELRAVLMRMSNLTPATTDRVKLPNGGMIYGETALKD